MFQSPYSILFVTPTTGWMTILLFRQKSTISAKWNFLATSVIAYNHTAMCLVESYIGVVKSHSCISMLNAHISSRFHVDAVQDFVIKRNFTWYSQKGLPSNTTAHQVSACTCICGQDQVCAYSFRLLNHISSAPWTHTCPGLFFRWSLRRRHLFVGWFY